MTCAVPNATIVFGKAGACPASWLSRISTQPAASTSGAGDVIRTAGPMLLNSALTCPYTSATSPVARSGTTGVT